MPMKAKLILCAAMAVGLWFYTNLSARSAEMPAHTIDMTTVLLDPHGEPLKDGETRKPDDKDCDRCAALTLGSAIANALFVPDKDAKAADLWARGDLAKRIRGDKAAVLSVDETARVKELLLKAYPSPAIAMQAIPLLDPNAKPGEVK